MVSQPEIIVFQGNVVDSSDGSPLRATNCVLGVREGKIIFREAFDRLNNVIADYDINKEEIRILSPREFIMPGFVDIHIHAPQFKFLGNHMDLTLLDWLKTYTLPAEATFCDLEVAKDVYTKVVNRTLSTGTTTAMYFATVHLDASLLLCDLAAKLHQRAYVGKVSMDRKDFDYCQNLCEESGNALRDAEEFINKVLNKQNPLLTPVVTPRFAPSCTPQLLKALGELTQLYQVPVQSHLAEMKDELTVVKKYFPFCKNYTEVYDHFNLLTDKTVMAHGIYLSNDETYLLKSRGTGIAHCPNSNISIRSGLCDVQNLRSSGVNVGLGTDVAAGYSTSMLDAMRYAIATSKILSFQKPNYHYLTHRDAFYLATLGGCKVLKTDDYLGTLEVNKQFDALLINVEARGHVLETFGNDDIESIVEKFIYLGDDRNITDVYVSGHKININK